MALDANTIVLLHFDQDVTTDEKSHAFTSSGSPVLKLGKFRSAAYLDASSSIYMPTNIDILSNDFTIDFWLKFTSSPADSVTAYLLALGSDNEEELFQFSLKLSANNGMVALVNDTLHDQVLTHAEVAALGTDWFHVAFVYDHTTPSLTFYLNGIQKKVITTTVLAVDLEALFDEYSVGTLVAHYIDEFRVSDTKRWTEPFDPPTAAYGDETVRINYKNTKAHLTFNTDAITDATGKIWAINGSMSVTSTSAKFTSALLCSSTGGNNFLKLQDSLILGTNNFIMSGYLNITSTTYTNSTQRYVIYLKNATSAQEISIKTDGTNVILTCGSQTATAAVTTGSTNKFYIYYDALDQKLYMHIDGSSPVDQVFTNVSFTNTTNWTLSLGGYNENDITDTNNYSFDGIIDDFSILVGVTKKQIDSIISNSTVEYSISDNVVNQDSNTKIILLNQDPTTTYNKNVVYDDMGGKYIQYGGQLKKFEMTGSNDVVIGNSEISPYNYIKAASDTTVALGTSGFTIDFYAKSDKPSAQGQILFELYNTTTSDTIAVQTDVPSGTTETSLMTVYNTRLSEGTVGSSKSAASISSAFKHIVVEYNPSTNKLSTFVDGAKHVSDISDVSLSNTTTWKLSLFNSYSSPTLIKNFVGKLDQFRLSTGGNRYTSDGTAFTDSTVRSATAYVADGIYAALEYPLKKTTIIPLKL